MRQVKDSIRLPLQNSQVQRAGMLQGLTLFELMVVMVIAATLVTVMLTHVWHLQAIVRKGKLFSARGAVSTSAMLIHAATLTRGNQPDSRPCADGGVANNVLEGAGTVCNEVGLIETMHGYPASVALGQAGIVSAAGLGGVFNPSEVNLLTEGYLVTVMGDITRIARADAPVPEKCSFTYVQALAAAVAATVSVPVTSGC